MNRFLLLFLLCAGLVIYSIHRSSLKEAEDKAAAAAELAMDEARAEERAKLDKERTARNAMPMMAVSKVIEPLLVSVQAPLDPSQPADIVPVIEITKQRILDRRVHAEPGRAPVFDRAAAAMDYLIALAEERTKSLEVILKNRATAVRTLDRPKTASNNDFFNQNVTKHWDDTVSRARPILGKLVEQLRSAEREWNGQVPKGNPAEVYDLPELPPLLIPTDQTPPLSALTATPAPKDPAAGHPWRSSYYSSNGYRGSSVYP